MANLRKEVASSNIMQQQLIANSWRYVAQLNHQYFIHLDAAQKRSAVLKAYRAALKIRSLTRSEFLHIQFLNRWANDFEKAIKTRLSGKYQGNGQDNGMMIILK